MMYPLVVDLAAEGVRVSTSCRVLGFSTQAFYKWCKQPWSNSEWDDAHLINELVDLHADDPEFGYRFLHDELVAAGHGIGANRVHRLCRQNEVWSVFAKKRGLGRKAGPPVHDDLVKRHFKAEQPDQVWLTDITEHWTNEGKLYMCAFKDVCSGRIVGYALSDRMTAALAVRALDNAVIGRNKIGTIVHSDRGSQFRSRAFVKRLKHHKMVGSMGRVGACGDNAMMESFFSLLQKNVLDRQRWRTRAELTSRIVNWVERTYHRRRRQPRLGKLTPVEFELVFTPQATAA
jgi:putative transposase